ncbi:hypothetical protein GW17_00044732 [Ensete ventricosum]|nr:hypothetical protein GW17_00044732 [Ensete ventricosum]
MEGWAVTTEAAMRVGGSSNVAAVMRTAVRETLAAVACDQTQWDTGSSFDLLCYRLTTRRERIFSVLWL